MGPKSRLQQKLEIKFMDQAVWDTFGHIVTALTLLATVGIAFAVGRASKRSAVLQTEGLLRSSWIALDQAVLQDDRLLEIKDCLLHPDDDQASIEERRFRWA